MLDALLKRVSEIAAEAAAAPPANPYAVMFGMDDADSLPNKVRTLIQDIRSTEPALAERITSAVCGGDAVKGATPAGAYTKADGNAYLKSIAAKMAGGTLVLSADGAAEAVNGIAIEHLAACSQIEKTEFTHGEVGLGCLLGKDSYASNEDDEEVHLKGTVDSVLSYESEVTKEKPFVPDRDYSDYGAPAMKTITLKVSCTLAVAAGAASCVATATLSAPDPGWELPDVRHGEDIDTREFYTENDRCPALALEVDITSGTVSESEMATLCNPDEDDFNESFSEDFHANDEKVTSALFTPGFHLFEEAGLKQHPLFVVLGKHLTDSIW